MISELSEDTTSSSSAMFGFVAGASAIVLGVAGAAGSDHGGKQPYIDVLSAMLSSVSNGGSGVLVPRRSWRRLVGATAAASAAEIA